MKFYVVLRSSIINRKMLIQHKHLLAQSIKHDRGRAWRFNIPKSIKSDLHVVEFADGNLEDPKSDPIGVYSKWGTRRFIWRDTIFLEYNLDANRMIKQINESITESWLTTTTGDILHDMLKKYSRDSFTVTENTLNQNRSRVLNADHDGATSSIVRILYKAKHQDI